MKKLRTMLALMVAAVSVCLVTTACSNDDNDTPTVPAAKSVEGIYRGNMTCTVMNQPSTFENMTYTVTATDDATVKVVISEFGEAPMAMPSITVEGVKVTGSDGSYVLAPTEFSGTSSSGKAYSGTLRGSFAENTLSVEFNLQYGAMPMPMICAFSAVK